MSLNSFMHSRNIYKDNPPKFEELAKLFPEFEKHVKYSKSGKSYVNFRDPRVVRCLCVCLFARDFNLKVDLPPDRLAPTIPLRLNYLLWIEDLVNCVPGCGDVTILDIGCGSSCVYPLLGCRLVEEWKFIATEIDGKNLAYARRNVESNNLCDRITVATAISSDPLLGHPFDVCMCNPPFFTHDEELLVERDRPVANSSCSGDKCELVGGDYLFAERIFNESLLSKSGELWFTVMLGKKTSCTRLKTLLRHEKVESVCYTEFCQGRTMRWGVAWSFRKIDTSSVVRSKPMRKRKSEVSSFTSKHCFSSETVEATKVLLHSLGLEFSQNNSSFLVKGDIALALPNRKERRKSKHANDVLNHLPTTKELKSLNAVSNRFDCEIKIIHVPTAPPTVELKPLTEGFPDLFNRLYSHLRKKL